MGTKSSITGQSVDHERPWNTVLTGMLSSDPSSWGLGKYEEEDVKRLSERMGMEDTKRASPSSHNSSKTCVNAQELWLHAQVLHRSKSDGVLAQREQPDTSPDYCQLTSA